MELQNAKDTGGTAVSCVPYIYIINCRTKLKPIASNFAHLIKQENVENGEFSAAFIQETDPYPDPPTLRSAQT